MDVLAKHALDHGILSECFTSENLACGKHRMTWEECQKHYSARFKIKTTQYAIIRPDINKRLLHKREHLCKLYTTIIKFKHDFSHLHSLGFNESHACF